MMINENFEYEVGKAVQIMPLPENMEVMVQMACEDNTFRYESVREDGNTYCLALCEREDAQTVEVMMVANEPSIIPAAKVVPVRYCQKCGKQMWPHYRLDASRHLEDGAVFYVCDSCDEVFKTGSHEHYDNYEKKHGSERKEV